MTSPSDCLGPVLCEADGIYYCRVTGLDEYDCEACGWEEWDR